MPQYLDLEAHTTVNVSELLGGVKPPPPKEPDTPDESERVAENGAGKGEK